LEIVVYKCKLEKKNSKILEKFAKLWKRQNWKEKKNPESGEYCLVCPAPPTPTCCQSLPSAIKDVLQQLASS
jgi:hypothetical protein